MDSSFSGSISQEMDKVVFDLDGTLLDSRERLHTLFTKLVPQIKLSYDEYWEIKFKGVSHEDLINSKLGELIEFDYKAFQEEWMCSIESPEYLSKDKPYDESSNVLETLKKMQIKMFLCTARQNIYGVEQQLAKFNWTNYFDDVYITEQKKTKKELLDNKIDWQDALFIGDTSQDIKLAQSYGGVSVAVTHGFRSEEYLRTFNPDYLINNISHLINLL